MGCFYGDFILPVCGQVVRSGPWLSSTLSSTSPLAVATEGPHRGEYSPTFWPPAPLRPSQRRHGSPSGSSSPRTRASQLPEVENYISLLGDGALGFLLLRRPPRSKHVGGRVAGHSPRGPWSADPIPAPALSAVRPASSSHRVRMTQAQHVLPEALHMDDDL